MILLYKGIYNLKSQLFVLIIIKFLSDDIQNTAQYIFWFFVNINLMT